jgi:hypothetical protein
MFFFELRPSLINPGLVSIHFCPRQQFGLFSSSSFVVCTILFFL